MERSIYDIVQDGFAEKKTRSGGSQTWVCASEIDRNIGFTKQYNRGFWLRAISRSGVTYNELCGLLKEANAMDSKYNRAGWLYNKMRARFKPLQPAPKQMKLI